MTVIEKYRIFPRLVLILYLVAVGVSLEWYFDFPTTFETQCDSNTLRVLMENNIEVDKATSIACSNKNVIGRPGGYTALVTILIGAGTGIFGFYVNTGVNSSRKDLPKDS